MSKKNFDYNGAREAGYTDEEITPFLMEQYPKFDYEGAIQSGYSPKEINLFLSSYKPEHSNLEKAGRVAAQYALGAASNAALPYEIAAMPLANQDAQNVNYRQTVMEDIERLQDQKETGVWDEKDQELYDHLIDQIKNPEKQKQYVQTADISVRGLAEKATGVDLEPEGVLEKGANWLGFMKNPKNLVGITPKEVLKNLTPTLGELGGSLGAGIGLQMAEDGEFGPIGTMTAAIVGDVAGRGLAGAAKGIVKTASNPRKMLAEVAAKFTPKDKINLQKELIKDFREVGLQPDIGTITNSNLMKSVQSRLAQSGLTGDALEKLKQELTHDIETEYKKLADTLGEKRYQTLHEAGEIAQNGIKKIRDADLQQTRDLYKAANDAVKENAFVDSHKLMESIKKVEAELTPGSLKSTEQQKVLDILNVIKRDIQDSEGNLLYGKVKDLINNKIALNDVINYEVQGGTKQLLKGIVGDIDRAIISYGNENPLFAKNYISANKRFSEHAKTFRNRSVAQTLSAHDPMQLMNKMNTVQGLRDMGKILNKTPEGKQIFDGLKRQKFDNMIGNKMTDNVAEQIKLGTFSNILKNPKDAQVIREILGKPAFEKLQRLQKSTGKLASTAQKFYNASKSGVTVIDAALIGKVVTDVSMFIGGNPWPLIQSASTLAGGRYLTSLMGDAQFLKLVEEAVLASEKNNIPKMLEIGQQMEPIIKAAMMKTQEQSKD